MCIQLYSSSIHICLLYIIVCYCPFIGRNGILMAYVRRASARWEDVGPFAYFSSFPHHFAPLHVLGWLLDEDAHARRMLCRSPTDEVGAVEAPPRPVRTISQRMDQFRERPSSLPVLVHIISHLGEDSTSLVVPAR